MKNITYTTEKMINVMKKKSYSERNSLENVVIAVYDKAYKESENC